MNRHAVVCACGRRLEYETFLSPRSADFEMLRTAGHDPDECSRRIGYEGRFAGRREMLEETMIHLGERNSLSGPELHEIRGHLSNAVATLPLGRVG